MPAPRLRLLTLPIAAAVLVACSGAGASPTPEPPVPDDAAFRLRVTAVQALPPPATFSSMPSVLITLDGRVLSGGAVPAIFPGPLLMPVIERLITGNGWAKIVAAAREAGLLGANRDFTGGEMPPGSMVTRLELVTDGQLYQITGDASRVMHCITAPCSAQPGTPEAFAGFVNRLTDLTSWLGADIGPEAIYVPSGYAILVGPPPDDQGMNQPPLAWPFDVGFAAFGKAVTNGTAERCGTITGDDAAELRPGLQAATSITRWREADGSFHGLTVRPLLPGDGDPCEGMV
jgi:hypothetical protein